jgi:hypothetical protein
MDYDHAILQPSGSLEWRYCPGSILMQAMATKMDNGKAADQGNAAHWAGSEILNGVETGSLLGLAAPNGYVITREILRYVDEYVGAVRGLMKLHPDADLWIEHRVDISTVHSDCWGTFDLGVYVPSLRLVYILDLKYGYGQIEPRDNSQLNLYALGFMEELVKRSRPVDQIKVGVIQPRGYHPDGPVRIVDVTKKELYAFRLEMQVAAERAVVPAALCITGQHCKNCEARGICPALRKATDNAMDFVEMAQPEQLTGANLGLYLQLLKQYKELLDARYKSLSTQALDLINRGQPVLGHHVGPGRGSRDWNKPDADIKLLGMMADIEMTKETLLSPNQAETAGLDKKIVAAYVIKTVGKPKLMGGDPSELAERIFNK